MKHSTPIFQLLAGFVLAGVVLLFGVQFWQYFSDPLTTTMVYHAETEVALSVDGWVVREEEAFHTDGGTLIHARTDGEKVGVGQTLATAYSSVAALDTVKKIEEKQLQLQQLEYALESYLDLDAALKLDGAISESLLLLRTELSRGDYSSAAENISELKGNILKRSHSYSSGSEIQAQISAVKKEISGLEDELSGSTTIRARKAGIYAAVCDGYEETLTLSFLEDLTPAKLQSIDGSGQEGNVGKLIYGNTWYYAFTLTPEAVQQMQKSSDIRLRFAKGLEQDVDVSVVSVSDEQDGRQAVVVCSNKYMSQVCGLRHQSATLVLGSYEGLRIPVNALRLDKDGQSGVYCLVGYAADFKPVEVVYQGDGYTLVRPQSEATGGNILRSGDEVIVTASELYDGKVVQ